MPDFSITNILVLITVVASLLAVSNQELFYKFKFYPFGMNRKDQSYRFFSYALIHADHLHLAVNMYVLYSFGNLTEDLYSLAFQEKGAFFFFLLYVAGAFSSVIPSFEKHRDHAWYSAVGASGAVSAVVFSTIIFQPSMGMGLLFLPFYIPAWMFGLFYLAYSYFMAQKGGDNIGHDAHLFGALFGLFFTTLLDYHIGLRFVEAIFS